MVCVFVNIGLVINMTFERAIELFPETIRYTETGMIDLNSQLRIEARELYPFSQHIYGSHLLATCAEVWKLLASSYFREQTRISSSWEKRQDIAWAAKHAEMTQKCNEPQTIKADPYRDHGRNW